MTDCDCFSKNCKRQFASVNSAGSPPSPIVIFTDPPSSPPEAGAYCGMASLENEVVNDETATQPNLTICEDVSDAEGGNLMSHDGHNSNRHPETAAIVSDAEDENLMSHDDRNNNHHPRTVDVDGGDTNQPEVITMDMDVHSDAGGTVAAHSNTDESHRRRASSNDYTDTEACKKTKMECDRPDTPRPVEDYSDEDERALQMYQDKLLKESLAAARNTYMSLTDLLLYKLRLVDFNSEAPRDMMASLKVLTTLNRLYRTANLELDRIRQDDYGAEFFDI